MPGGAGPPYGKPMPIAAAAAADCGWSWGREWEAAYNAAPRGNPIGKAAGANKGLLAILSRSNSDSWTRFAFALLFWNHIFTWVSVKFNEAENSALSAIDRYCFCLNFLSRASNCWVVKGVLGFLFVLCFLKAIERGNCEGPSGPLGRLTPTWTEKVNKNYELWK